jgi:3-oxoacyl-[acyl-carrier protein] reductase
VTLAEKVALVTGGSSGLGRAIVAALVRAGATVAFTYRTDVTAAQALVAELSPAGTLVAWQGNVDAEADVARFIAETVARFGRLDILVNNAGIIRDSLVLRLRPEDWQAVIETDLIGTVRCCRYAVPHLVAGGGSRIINIASVAGVVGSAGQANYSAAKAGLIGLTEALARELAPHGVTVNAVAPGAIDSGVVAGLPEEARRRLLAVIPMGRMGTAEEIAALVVFLAGPQAGFITGQTIVVDGGVMIPASAATDTVPSAGTLPGSA